MRADNTRHLIAAARHRAERTRDRAVAALRRMDAAGQMITFDAVAREAGVSRSWLYTQDDLRNQIQLLRQRRGHATTPAAVPARQHASGASLLRRLEAATARIRLLQNQNQELRDALAKAHGERRTAIAYGTIPAQHAEANNTPGNYSQTDHDPRTAPSTTRPPHIAPGQRHDQGPD
jgi:Family of unknown function (DUF6262)